MPFTLAELEVMKEFLKTLDLDELQDLRDLIDAKLREEMGP